MDKSSLYQKSDDVPTEYPDAPRKMSRGEFLTDFLNYTGIAGIGAFFATIPIAYYLKHGNGKRIHQSLANGIEWIANKISHGDHKKMAENVSMTTSLMWGGNAMAVLVGIVEKFRVPIANKFNQWLGDPTPRETLEEAPKQTWSSIVKARTTAWGVVFTSMYSIGHIFPRSFGTFSDEFAERWCQFRRKPFMENGQPSRTYNYGQIAGLDIFATAAAAILLYIGGHFFARKQEERKERKLERQHARGMAFADAVANDNVGIAANENRPATRVADEKIHDGAVVGVARTQAV